MFKDRTFKFSKEITVLVVLAALVCAYLSHWQYSRYVEKQDYFILLEKQETRGLMPLDLATPAWEDLYHARVSITGTWDHAHAVVIMNRSIGPTPGVKVVTPLLVTDDKGDVQSLLVDRGFLPYEDFDKGWLAKQSDSQPVALEGILRPSQHAAFRYAPPEHPVAEGVFKQRWLRLNCEEMAQQLETSVPPVYLEQTNTAEGYPAYNEREIIGPARHLNYVLQWGGFGLFALFIGTIMQFPKNKQRRRQPLAV